MPTSINSPEVQAAFDQARTPQTKTVPVGGETRTIPSPFPSPADWRDQWIYFLLVDRFNNPAAPPRVLPCDAAVWPSELRHNNVFRRKGRGGEAGGDFESLKEMVTDLRALDEISGAHFPVRNALIRAYQYTIAKFDVDGFRIDTLKFIEPEFTLLGIPCLYYGTEQGLHGAGNSDSAVREALWGKPTRFARDQPIYKAIEELAAVRARQPALRYGRQYFRPLSGDGFHFGISPFSSGVLAWSRILHDQELLIVANTHTQSGFTGAVIVDLALNPAGLAYEVIYTNTKFRGGTPPGTVVNKPGGGVEIHEVNGAVTRGPARVLPVTLDAMELQILRKRP